MKIRTKILIPMIAIAMVTAIAILLTVTVVFSLYVDATTEGDINQAAIAMVSEYERQLGDVADASALIAGDAALQSALAEGSRDRVLERALYYQDRMGVDFITITDPLGTAVVRAHEPDNYGDSVSGQANVQQAMAGNTYATLETGSAVKLSVRAGVPVYADGVLVGVVSSGHRLDTDTFVDHIKRLTGAEATVFLGDERLSTTVTDADGKRAVGTKAAENVSGIVLSGQEYSGKAQVAGREAFVRYMPAADAEGRIVGMLFVGKFTDTKWHAVRDFTLRGGVVALLLLIASVAVTLMISGRITVPIKELTRVGDRLAAGETDIDIRVKTKDEIRDLGNSFKAIIDGSREQERVITSMAAGDFTAEAALRSEKDTVATALQKMLEMNNRVFSRIHAAAGQVADSSRQIANVSQNLAQGSSEQAGTVEELSVSISAVTENARENADMANKAAALSDSTRGKAEEGSRQMKDLKIAVNEINEAGKDIAGVIKVIEDIAFQTNILALNAAVEAARAGAYGKGFAVVAEEVRNLAGKSAEAAKNTGSMINNSIEKAKLGADIAADTAASLEEIVKGINENSRMVGKIADSSAEASDAIEKINVGIEQMTRVVQQNSATAEESAAAGEEMSGQSELLLSLVSGFRLKDAALGISENSGRLLRSP